MPTFDDTNDARIDGKDAYRCGKPQGACPEPPGTVEYWAWNYGWRNAQAHHVAMSRDQPARARELFGYAVGDLARAAGAGR